MSNAYDKGKAAYGNNQYIPKMPNYADQQRANAGWWHAKQGK
ncbi:hypothetical protein ACSSV4_004395 [Roseovarius sp. MBR-154]